jgi:hypothetical protein
MERAVRINKLWRETTYISCWSSADHESYALWKLFCGSNEGVAISVPRRWLQQGLGEVGFYVVIYGIPGAGRRTPNANWRCGAANGPRHLALRNSRFRLLNVLVSSINGCSASAPASERISPSISSTATAPSFT